MTLFLLLLAVGLPERAPAATPEEDEASRLCTALLDDPAEPFAARRLYALERLRDWLPAGSVESCLDRLPDERGVPADLARQAAALRATLGWEAGDDQLAAASAVRGGLVSGWSIAGPFVDPRRSPLAGGGTVAEAVAAWRAGEPGPLPGRDGPVELVDPPAPRADGVLDVGRTVPAAEGACALLHATVDVPRDPRPALFLGGAAELSVWLAPQAPDAPAEPVIVPAVRDGHAPFRASIALPPRASRVDVLIGVCPEGGDATVRVAVGAGRTAVEAAEDRVADRAAGAARRAPLLDAAELLVVSGGLPPAGDPLAGALATVAPADAASAALLLARSAASAPARQAAAVRALRLTPDDLEVLLAVVGEGRELEGLPGVAEALRRAGEVAPTSVRVGLALAADSLANGLPLGAEAWLRPRLAASSVPVAVLRAAVEVAQALGRVAERRELSERILAVRPRDDAAWEERFDAAVAAGDADAIRGWLAGFPFADGGAPLPQPSLALERLAARTSLRVGDVEAAIAILERLAAERPSDETAWFDLGWALARAEREDDAERALRRGLALRPSDALARTWIAARSTPDPDEQRWLEPGTDLAELVRDARSLFPDASTVYAFRSVVVTLDAGGGVRERHRRILRVQTGSGADALRELPLAALDPGRTVFQLRRMSVRDVDGRARGGASVSWSGADLPEARLFTPTRFAAVSLPRLRAGDTVDVEFELLDVGTSFLPQDSLAREYGVRDVSPTALLRVAGVVPGAVPPLLDAPQGLDARTEQGASGSGSYVLWEARNVPGVEFEVLAPPLREVAGAVRLTTFGSWQDVAGWIGALWRSHGDDARLAERWAEADAASIYRDVASTVRYVAAEYGSHGLAPAAPSVVLARGWGDCKDKTALLLAALDAAGIQAVPALVRTRWAGDDPSAGGFAFPYAFDHVIAYLPPPLDRFVDPTATRLPWDVLPRSDRGASALVLDPSGARAVTIPAEPPPEEGIDRRDLVFLDPSCEAALVGNLGAGGADAGDLRELLAAPDLRPGILAVLLRRELPDVRFVAVDVEGLEPDAPRLRADYVGSIPAFCRLAADALEAPLGVRFDLVERFASADQRVNDLELIDAGFPVHWRRDVQIGLSGNWSWGAWPAPVRESGEFGSFSLDVRPEGGMLHVSVDLTIPLLRVDAGRYTAFRAFLARVDAALDVVAKAVREGPGGIETTDGHR
ncbi:MAG: tetratricopeptide repeat protein [Deltaproteobacteria bacterium]|nr:tetratricopeptide repeat protein [Deltaproteobacteria bacterium]